MYYSLIRSMDIANGPGIRVSLFVSGCSHDCHLCHNPQTHSYINGQPYTLDTQSKILSLLSKPYVRGLTLSGGDPLFQKSDDIRDWLVPLADMAKEMGKDIWIWSGFIWEDIFKEEPHGGPQTVQEAVELTNQRSRKDLILACDVLVDGPYIDAQKDITLPYCGSTNQRVIDIHSTLKHYHDDGVIDLWEN